MKTIDKIWFKRLENYLKLNNAQSEFKTLREEIITQAKEIYLKQTLYSLAQYEALLIKHYIESTSNQLVNY